MSRAPDHGIDGLSRFLLESSNVRGEIVQLDATWDAVLSRKSYPPPVRRLLGEAMSATALMAATIKFDGSLILQIRGTGPVHMLVVQATARHTMRGLARWRGEVGGERLDELVGEGRMAITIDPGPGMERYQSVIDLVGGSLADALERYFESSEQLPTRFRLAASAERCAGFLVQKLPPVGGRAAPGGVEEDEAAWRQASLVARTVASDELLRWPAAMLLRRLFPDRPVRLFEGSPLRFHCGCSRAVIESTLRALGPEELRTTLAEEGGEIRVDCEFCDASYTFDAVDVEQLFAGDTPRPPEGTRH